MFTMGVGCGLDISSAYVCLISLGGAASSQNFVTHFKTMTLNKTRVIATQTFYNSNKLAKSID